VKLVLPIFVLAALAGRLSGGRFSNLERLRPAWLPLALIGFALQVAPVPGTWPLILLMASFAVLLVFALKNVRLAGFPLVVLGVVLNGLVLGVNHGMPVSERAIVASGQEDALAGLVAEPTAKHHLAGDGDELLFLADVIAIPQPVGQIVSVGDVFTYAGVAWMIVVGMRRRSAIVALAAVPLREPEGEVAHAS
jgi:hypothetical protein